MKKETISFKHDHRQILILTFFSILIGSSYPYLQYGIDGGLVLSGIVEYQDFNSPMVYYFFNSWTSVHQFSSILLQIGIGVENSSKILMVLSTIFFRLEYFYFAFQLLKKKFITFDCYSLNNFR